MIDELGSCMCYLSAFVREFGNLFYSRKEYTGDIEIFTCLASYSYFGLSRGWSRPAAFLFGVWSKHF